MSRISHELCTLTWVPGNVTEVERITLLTMFNKLRFQQASYTFLVGPWQTLPRRAWCTCLPDNNSLFDVARVRSYVQHFSIFFWQCVRKALSFYKWKANGKLNVATQHLWHSSLFAPCPIMATSRVPPEQPWVWEFWLWFVGIILGLESFKECNTLLWEECHCQEILWTCRLLFYVCAETASDIKILSPSLGPQLRIVWKNRPCATVALSIVEMCLTVSSKGQWIQIARERGQISRTQAFAFCTIQQILRTFRKQPLRVRTHRVSLVCLWPSPTLQCLCHWESKTEVRDPSQKYP